ELARNRLVERVQRAEREIARRDVGNDDAEAVDVEHLRERDVLLLHLLVDRRDVLLAPVHVRVDLEILQPLLQRVLDFPDGVAAISARLAQRLLEDAETRGMQIAEAEVLELVVERVESQAI